MSRHFQLLFWFLWVKYVIVNFFGALQTWDFIRPLINFIHILKASLTQHSIVGLIDIHSKLIPGLLVILKRVVALRRLIEVGSSIRLIIDLENLRLLISLQSQCLVDRRVHGRFHSDLLPCLEVFIADWWLIFRWHCNTLLFCWCVDHLWRDQTIVPRTSEATHCHGFSLVYECSNLGGDQLILSLVRDLVYDWGFQIAFSLRSCSVVGVNIDPVISVLKLALKGLLIGSLCFEKWLDSLCPNLGSKLVVQVVRATSDSTVVFVAEELPGVCFGKNFPEVKVLVAGKMSHSLLTLVVNESEYLKVA